MGNLVNVVDTVKQNEQANVQSKSQNNNSADEKSKKSVFIEEVPYKHSSKGRELNYKIREYNDLMESISNRDFSNVQKDEVVRDKHKVANFFNRTAIVGGCVSLLSLAGLVLGYIGGSGDKTLRGLLIALGGGLAVGLGAGIPSTSYINKKIDKISNDELVKYYTDEAEKLKAEIEEEKNKLNYEG